LRFNLKKWNGKINLIKKTKAVLLLVKAFKNNSVLSKHRKKTFNLFYDFSNKMRNYIKMHLLSIMFTVDNNRDKICKSQQFLERIKSYHLFRTIHLLCYSSVKCNRIATIYKFYERKTCNSKLESFFGSWKNQIRKEVIFSSNQKNRETYFKHQSNWKLFKLLRRKALNYHVQDIKSAGRRIRTVDLLFTIDAIIINRVRRNTLLELFYLKKESEQFVNAKAILQDLYKEMKLSYLKTLEDYDNLEESYGYNEYSAGETAYNSSLAYESEEEKIRFKYVSKQKPKETQNWWDDFEIKPSD
jgi:hypothetical protein